MLKKKIKELTLGEALWIIFMCVCGGFALFCFMMAFVTALSRPAHAAEAPAYRYEVMNELPRVERSITPEVCVVVGQSARVIKSMIDRGATNDEIIKALSNAANTNPQDENGWIAYHMVARNKVIDDMRQWPNEKTFQWLRGKFPDFTMQDSFDVYASSLCDQKLGNRVKVVQVKKVPM